jgi:serine protease Do
MNDQSPRPPLAPRKFLKLRRLAPLASVAGLSVAVLIVGPGGYRPLNLPAWTASAHAAEAAQAPAGFADLVSKVKPAVISVRVRIDDDGLNTAVSQRGSEGTDPDQSDSPFDQFFSRKFGFRGPNAVPQRRQIIIGEGSGFFISPDGYAVTNDHVVDRAKSVQVTTSDGTVYTAKVVGTDQKTDLALIKVDGKKNFSYVKFADQPPRIGDWLVAVGNPFGLGGTVTAGIVSARGRDIGAGPYDDYLQIDAPINKGNSGGPAFDASGNVIGVNTAIFSPSGGSVGIGFDIPAATAKLVVAQLKDKGYITRGWLGVQVQPVTADIADSLGMKQARGALVDNPEQGSPAAKAGIEPGDVITAVNGTAVKDSRGLARRISMMAPGSSVNLEILHNGEAKPVTLTLGEMPIDHEAKAGDPLPEDTAGTPHLGLTLAPAGDVDGAGQKGVVVTSVDPEGSAAEHGLQGGDIILNVGGKAVANAGDVRSALKEANANGKHSVLMQVKTADATKFVAVPLAKG